jgi:hypothetical protein
MLFISCLYDVYRDLPPPVGNDGDPYMDLRMSTRLHRLEYLTCCDVDILLFIDPSDVTRCPPTHPRMRIVPLALEELTTYQHVVNSNAGLPSMRGEAKDTLPYMGLINSKPEMMSIGKSIDPTFRSYGWIDSGIFKVIHDPSAAKQQIERLSSMDVDKIVSPGGHQPRLEHDWLVVDCPYWRFLGGLLMMPMDAVDHFARASFKTLANCIMATKKATWEVNVWSNIEARYPDLFYLYDANHDDSMLNYQEKLEAPQP